MNGERTCPACDTPLEYVEDDNTYYCPEPTCPEFQADLEDDEEYFEEPSEEETEDYD